MATLCYQQKLREKRIKHSPAIKNLGILVDGKNSHNLAIYHHSENQLYPVLHQKKHGQQTEGGVPVLCASQMSHGVMCPGVESSIQERYGPVGLLSEEGHKNDPRDGTSPLQGQAERAGAVQPGEEKARSSLSGSKGAVRKDGLLSRRG